MFDDITLPALREDLNIEVIDDNNEKFVVLSDPHGFALQPVAIPVELIPLLQMLNGTVSTKFLFESIKETTGEEPDISPLINLSNYLDYMGYLDSIQFRQAKQQMLEYLNSTVRVPVCAGHSYPEDKESLELFINSILTKHNTENNTRKKITSSENTDTRNSQLIPKGIIVPHIDFRIGHQALDCYGAAYSTIKDTQPQLIVILGTAHYSNADIFMISEKDFQTPLGIIKTDKLLIKEIKQHYKTDESLNELAHRFEHSIELQLVFIQSLFKNIDFKILPILVGSFSYFIDSDIEPHNDSRFINFISSLQNILKSQNRNVLYIASADLAHIGKKFGDDFNAEEQLESLKKEDLQLIESLTCSDHQKFFNLIKSTKDSRKICGLPPIYSMLSIINASNIQLLKYGQWNEIETNSAVSFASLVLYD
jgi:hypothetical protein